MGEENEKRAEGFVTFSQLKLELKALKSDMRLLIVGSLIAGQVLNNISIPGTATATAAIAGGAWIAGKLLAIAFLR